MPTLIRPREVRPTPEFKRIRELPRRIWADDPDLETFRLALTKRLARRRGVELRPMQAAALREIWSTRGLLVTADVGVGKSLVGLLAAELLGTTRNVYLVPGLGGGVGKIRDEARAYARDWCVPTTTFLSYERLAQEKLSKGQMPLLYRYRPQLLVCDEAGICSNTSNATWRLIKFTLKTLAAEGEPCKFIAMDASFTDGSLNQFAHLVRVALGPAHAPVPDGWHESSAWAGAMDVQTDRTEPVDPGCLEMLSDLTPAERRSSPIRRARVAFRRRLMSTRGVIGSGMSDRPAAGLTLRAVETELPESLQSALETLRAKRVTPGGERIRYALDLWRHATELACGYYTYPDPEPPPWWADPRREWWGFVADTLTHSRSLFKPADVARAVDEGHLTEGIERLRAWREVAAKFEPTSVVEWVDDSPLHTAAEWLRREPDRGLVWVANHPAGIRLSEISGVPFFAAKGLPTDLSRFPKKRIDKWDKSAIVSLSAIWKSFNLQRFCANLYLGIPATPRRWQQSMGRSHRSGQTRDVTVDVWLACDEHVQALAYAMRRARYVQDMFGSPQKLLYAANELPRAVVARIEQASEGPTLGDDDDEE